MIGHLAQTARNSGFQGFKAPAERNQVVYTHRLCLAILCKLLWSCRRPIRLQNLVLLTLPPSSIKRRMWTMYIEWSLLPSPRFYHTLYTPSRFCEHHLSSLSQKLECFTYFILADASQKHNQLHSFAFQTNLSAGASFDFLRFNIVGSGKQSHFASGLPAFRSSQRVSDSKKRRRLSSSGTSHMEGWTFSSHMLYAFSQSQGASFTTFW
jgi:hypothetical protein